VKNSFDCQNRVFSLGFLQTHGIFMPSRSPTSAPMM
jgi:hypothetical protein